ncbi:MAG: SRPBCC family protein [Myxococcales bacterium]|nr:SRPBCC family protein [Myxococcales bacterium]
MKFVNEIEAQAPAAAAWQLLGERFGDIASWSSGIDASQLDGELGVGATRECRSSESFGPFPPSVVREKLTLFDRERMELQYEVEAGLPPFLQRASNHWRVEPRGTGGCRIVSEAELTFRWWALPLQLLLPVIMRSELRAFSAELKRAVEGEAACPTSTTAEIGA